MISEKLVYKSALIILILIIIGFAFAFFRINSLNSDLQEEYENRIKQEIERSEQKIKNHRNKILKANLIIEELNFSLKQYEHSLDSLEAVKQEVNIIYKDRVKEVNSFTETEITDYWKERFKSGF
jgi:hypothetical protein